MPVHPSAVISDGVELGRDVAVGPHAVILGPCRVGDGVVIGAGCVIGTPPEITTSAQNLAWNGELAHYGVVIEEGAVLREMTSIQQGSAAATVIGAGSWLLSRTYVAHDCVLGPAVTTSAGVTIGGHSRIGARANLGMNATVHQRRIVGAGAMIGMSAAVTRDIPPFAKAYGVPARVRGANRIGVIRAGGDSDLADALDAAFSAGSSEEAARILTRLGLADDAGHPPGHDVSDG